MAEELEKFVSDEISKRWESFVREMEVRYCPPFYPTNVCVFYPNYDDFHRKIEEIVLAVAADEKQAKLALSAVFDRLTCDAESSGNHHIGYQVDAHINTTKAIELANNSAEFHKIVNEDYLTEGAQNG